MAVEGTQPSVHRRPGQVLAARAPAAAWVALGVAAFALYLVTGGRWFQVAAVCAVAPVVVNLLWRPRRDGLEVHADPLPPRAVVGETVEQRFSAANTGRRPLGAFSLVVRSPGYEDLVVDVPALAPGVTAETTAPRRAVRRGGGLLNDLAIVTAAPFGLVERRLEGSYTAPLACVHPAPAPVPDLPGLGGTDGDEPSGRSARQGPFAHGVREWRPGDEVRKVHWRATARHGRLVVVEPAQAVEQPLALVVAGRADARAWEDLVAAAAAGVAAALAQGRAVLLLADDPERGSGDLVPAVLAPRDAGDAGDWFALLTAPGLPPPDLLRRAAAWAGRSGLVTVAATDPFLAEAVRTGAGTPYGRLDLAAVAGPAQPRPELAPDGVPAQLAFLLPRTPANPPTGPAGPAGSLEPVGPRVRVLRPGAAGAA